MVLHFLYGTYGYTTYETQSVYGLTIAEFLGNMESDEVEDFATSVFHNRLKSIGDDKIAYILSTRASDYATDDYEYEDLEYELSEGETDIYLISIAIDEEKQYSEVIRKFYQMIGTSLNDEDMVYYSSLVKFFQEYDKYLNIKHLT